MHIIFFSRFPYFYCISTTNCTTLPWYYFNIFPTIVQLYPKCTFSIYSPPSFNYTPNVHFQYIPHHRSIIPQMYIFNIFPTIVQLYPKCTFSIYSPPSLNYTPNVHFQYIPHHRSIIPQMYIFNIFPTIVQLYPKCTFSIKTNIRDKFCFPWKITVLKYHYTKGPVGLQTAQLILSLKYSEQMCMCVCVHMFCFFIIFFMHFYPGTMTTHAESINSDLQRGLDRRLRHTQHWTQNRTI